jgi:hypothetical protein
MEDLYTFFTVQNPYVHAKQILRKLSATWARTLK